MDELKKDARFAHIAKDPRFRPASKSERKLKIDRRFASMFNDPKFKLKYTVDKRGRPLVKEHTTRDDMKKFYHLEEEDGNSSTSSEEEEETEKERKLTDDEELDELLQSDESQEEEDDDEEEEDEEEEEDKSSSSDEDEEIPEVIDGETWNEFDDKCARSDDVSHRLAICNMDWDRVRAIDIFLLLNSWKPADGTIKSVTIYPSEYGIQQMEAEKKFGPLPGTAISVPITTDQNGKHNEDQTEAEEEPELPEIKSDDEDEEPNYNHDDDQDATDPIMRERLRKYQLNRLKYYYAVAVCDSEATAAHIYKECDGLEYETSAVRLDLRFIPDSVTFDSSIAPHDQCTQLPDKTLYKPLLFRNTALTQTKVRCTWDETPVERRRLTKKKYTLEELEKVDLDAYLASESDEEPQDDDDNINDESGDEDEKKNDDAIFKIPTSIPSDANKKTSNQPIARAPSVLSTQDDIDRYRALLLDFNEEPKSNKKSKKKLTTFFDEQNSDEEHSNQGMLDDDDDDDDSDIDMEITWQPGLKGKVDQKSQISQNQSEKKKPKNKKQEKSNLLREQMEQREEEEDDGPTENDRETLELLTVDDDIDEKRDYNLRDMIKSHKQSTKAAAKNAKKSKHMQQTSLDTSETNKNDDAFQLNVDDTRFKAIYDKSAFNIDQTDPRFKATAGTQRLIDEKLKKRKFDNVTSSSRTDRDEDDIVAKLKRKSAKKD
ncbi:unnamed protein product [Adineta steineri]|uniref:ESF1-like protein n=1 Tax=Adineta steineri TaxID=433720 RepID=A0A815DQM2_9BILA|nr:unnamed protein product [Adineta steineri]CAF1575954.1 unnamed protein product [Adineta steineri]